MCQIMLSSSVYIMQKNMQTLFSTTQKRLLKG